MVVRDTHRYVADISAPDGRSVGQLPLMNVDWEPAVLAANWAAVRRGELPPLMRCASATIDPSWHPDRGAPRVDGVRITCVGGDGARASSQIPRSYFRNAVETAALRLVQQGMLTAGERFFYEVCAFPGPEPARPHDRAAGGSFSVAEIPQPLPLVPDSLEVRLARASGVRESLDSDRDIPVLIPRHVVAEAEQLAREAGDVEWGGILIGNLYRDTNSHEIFSVVTALIPAQHTVAERARLTFTAETWAAARAALDLRREGELITGFAHSHPCSSWCRNCPEERRRTCPLLKQPFFSRDDVALMRAMFPLPFNVGLLLSDLGEDDWRCDLFGWRDGMVAARGFHLFGGVPRSGRALAPAAADVAAVVPEPVAPSDAPPRDGSSGAGACNTGAPEHCRSGVPQTSEEVR